MVKRTICTDSGIFLDNETKDKISNLITKRKEVIKDIKEMTEELKEIQDYLFEKKEEE